MLRRICLYPMTPFLILGHIGPQVALAATAYYNASLDLSTFHRSPFSALT